MVPRVGDALATWREERYDERLKAFFESGFAGVSAERLIEEIETNAEFADDLDRAVQAALASSSDEKIKLLSRTLRAEFVAQDRAAVDNVQQILRVAIELDPVDIRAMVAIQQADYLDPLEVLREELRATKATAYAIRSRLSRLGLIEMSTEATVATPGDVTDDEVVLEQRWTTTPVFDAVVLMLDDFRSLGA